MPASSRPGGKLALGKAGAARGRDRAGVDHEADAGALELVDDGGGFRLLVADGEEGVIEQYSDPLVPAEAGTQFLQTLDSRMSRE